VALRTTCLALHREEPPPRFPAHWDLAASPNDRYLKALLTFIVRNHIDTLPSKVLQLSIFRPRCYDSGSTTTWTFEAVDWPPVCFLYACSVGAWQWCTSPSIVPCSSPLSTVICYYPSVCTEGRYLVDSPKCDDFADYLAAQYDNWLATPK
jgi:hypothetical protein